MSTSLIIRSIDSARSFPKRQYDEFGKTIKCAFFLNFRVVVVVGSFSTASLTCSQFHGWTSQQTFLNRTGICALKAWVDGMWNVLRRGDFGTDLGCCSRDGILGCFTSLWKHILSRIKVFNLFSSTLEFSERLCVGDVWERPGSSVQEDAFYEGALRKAVWVSPPHLQTRETQSAGWSTG